MAEVAALVDGLSSDSQKLHTEPRGAGSGANAEPGAAMRRLRGLEEAGPQALPSSPPEPPIEEKVGSAAMRRLRGLEEAGSQAMPSSPPEPRIKEKVGSRRLTAPPTKDVATYERGVLADAAYMTAQHDVGRAHVLSTAVCYALLDRAGAGRDNDALHQFLTTVAELDDERAELVVHLISAFERELLKRDGQAEDGRRARMNCMNRLKTIYWRMFPILKRLGHEDNASALIVLFARCRMLLEQLCDGLWRGTGQLQEEADVVVNNLGSELVMRGNTRVTHVRQQRALEIEVREWEHILGPSEEPAPSTSRTILLTNLPLTITEEQITKALQPCGGLRSLKLCRELERRKVKEETWLTRRGKEPLRYTHLYAVAEFENTEAYRRATREAVKIFGIIHTELVFATPKAKKPRPVGRRAFPQEARWKRSLVISGFPVDVEPWRVLVAVAHCLGDRCELHTLNPGAFATEAGDRLQRLTAVVGADGNAYAQQQPEPSAYSRDVSEECGAGGFAVLRFASFEQAYLARQRLQRLRIPTRRGFMLPCQVGFSVRRMQLCEHDSFGTPLPAPRLLDYVLPPSCAVYPDAESDSVRRYGATLTERDGGS
eukprot:NODE_4386_length_1898_cov_3.523998.p1 GENE.NODE_4386_length_1898_cov_3.523998~~NODE_4386_length_1898_cov_3.523998.p1  ORF type:complete len:623 (-),score=110.45 NODE_4386_length_1898_cov_3.523998:29-1831(-)